MQAYASRTGTRRNLAALREAGWGLLLSPAGSLRTEGFSRIVLDNGAWSAYQQGRPFDGAAFQAAVERFADRVDWIVVPDIVCGGRSSLKFSESWLPVLSHYGVQLLLPVQNEMTPADVAPLLGPRCGIFVGGDSRWKEQTLPVWGWLAAERCCHLHVGRVNSVRRIRLCALAGAHSFDGTSASRYATTLGRLDSARRQGTLPLSFSSTQVSAGI